VYPAWTLRLSFVPIDKKWEGAMGGMFKAAGWLVTLLALYLVAEAFGGADKMFAAVFQNPTGTWDFFQFARGQTGLLIATIFFMLCGLMVMIQQFRPAAVFFAIGVGLAVVAGMRGV
jgi:hypothetical protein